MNQTTYVMNFENVILRQKVSHRGGGVEIDLSPFGYEGEKMTAYQNYLGGGLLGRVCSDCTIPRDEWDEKLAEISENLKRYFHNLTDPDTDTEWEGRTYEQNQNMPISAY